MARGLKFHALVERLRALPADQQRLVLSFAEIEALADGPLPRGAWASTYWSNSTVSRKNWARCGFRARLHRHRCAVEFYRCSSAAPARDDRAAPEHELLAAS
jgi:hypothetical protein